VWLTLRTLRFLSALSSGGLGHLDCEVTDGPFRESYYQALWSDGQAGLQAIDWQAGSMSQAALYWHTVDDELVALMRDAAAIDI
jgi:hypothetical protein